MYAPIVPVMLLSDDIQITSRGAFYNVLTIRSIGKSALLCPFISMGAKQVRLVQVIDFV